VPGCEVIGEAAEPAPPVPTEPVEPLVAEAAPEQPSAPEAPAPPETTTLEQIDFAQHVLPVLEANCTKCHGGEHQRGGLRVDSRDAILAGGESGPVVVLGNADASELVRRILLPGDDADHMPPSQSPQPSPDQLDLLRRWVAEEKPEEAPAEQPEAPVAPVAEEATSLASAYDAHVAPIFAANCVGCHGPEKQKGGLRLDSLAALETGGSSGATVVAGDPDASLLIQRVELPLDDYDHMPPEDAPQPSEEQLALLRWWIGAGANSDVPADAAPQAE
jgi:mono/diheme cytochrome c family protein